MSVATLPLRPEEKRAAVEQILTSDSFHRKETSKRLLSHLLEQHLNGRDEEASEYVLATSVFGKPADYDPAVDATVRVAVGKLREQLEHYRLSEGADNEISVVLPKRHYRLRFEDARTGPESARTTPEIAATGSRLRAWSPASIAAMAAVLLLVGAVAGIAAAHQLRPSNTAIPPAPATGRLFAAFWQPIRDSKLQTLVSLGTPLFVRFDGHRLRASSVEEFPEALAHEPMLSFRQILKSKRFQESRNYTGVGEAHAAFLVSNLLTKRGTEAKLVRNNALTWEEIGANNVIFLGPPKVNAHMAKLPTMRNFHITGSGIRNVDPRPGEPDIYRPVLDGEDSDQTVESHVVISRLPGLYERGRIYMFASTATYGTWAAGLCATQPTILEPILERMVAGGTHLPQYFELLIRARFANNVPVAMEYVSHREVQARASDPAAGVP